MYGIAPTEFAIIGLEADRFRKATNDEWHGPCPFCGGTDRMIIFTDKQFPHWNWFCRQCHPDSGWVDEINPKLREELTPAEIVRRATEEARRTEERLKKEIQRAQRAVEELQRAQSWLDYHDSLLKHGRDVWNERGIPDHYQDFWFLGYCEDYSLWRRYNGEWEDWWHTPTLSIPIRDPEWNVTNIKHRLLNVPENAGKYRYEKNGIPAQPFICSPDHKKGPLFIAEGEIKGMVVFTTLAEETMQVAGLPSAKPDLALLTTFKDYEPIYLCLDPGEDTNTIATSLGPERLRVIELPDKIDDLIVNYQLDRYWLEALMRTAKRVKA